MKILILGAGLMGSAAAYDLIRFGPDHQIGLADYNRDQLEAIDGMLDGIGELHQIDCNEEESVYRIFRDYDLALSAVPFRFNANLTRIAIETGTHFLDLGGNSDIVRKQLSFHTKAGNARVTVIPNCGLAPGLSNILAMTGFKQFDKVETIEARVGGLPQNPRPPLKYQLIFSVDGLLNEYLEEAEIIENGKRKSVSSMTGLESLAFNDTYQDLEAFYTSGGLSLLPELLEGKVSELSYKTIRYSGHCEKFKILLDIGFAGSEPVTIGGGIHTSRELFSELLRRKLTGTDKDVVLFRVDVTGIKNGEHKKIRYEMIDEYDPETRMTAMMRTTAYPTTAIALMILDGRITERGVILPEQLVDGTRLITDLSARNVKINESEFILSEET